MSNIVESDKPPIVLTTVLTEGTIVSELKEDTIVNSITTDVVNIEESKPYLVIIGGAQ